MGWNQGYAIMEKQIIEFYNSGDLTRDLLEIVMMPYKGTDCDSGGSNYLKANDGKMVEEIICFIMEPEKYKDAVENPEYEPGENECWGSNNKAYELFRSIWSGKWGIW